MKRSVISLLLGFIVISLSAAQKERYPVSQIPDSLRTDAYSVVRFESTYFELTQESFINMNELLADLEWAKMYLNEIKRR